MANCSIANSSCISAQTWKPTVTLPLNKPQQSFVSKMNRLRRVRLEEWEATMPNKCWLTIWMAFREKLIIAELEIPQLPQEWDDPRKWAKQYMKRHSHTSHSNPYYALSNMHSDTVMQTVQFIDDP